jgi:hypothetical protein
LREGASEKVAITLRLRHVTTIFFKGMAERLKMAAGHMGKTVFARKRIAGV